MIKTIVQTPVPVTDDRSISEPAWGTGMCKTAFNGLSALFFCDFYVQFRNVSGVEITAAKEGNFCLF